MGSGEDTGVGDHGGRAGADVGAGGSQGVEGSLGGRQLASGNLLLDYD